MMRTLKRRVQGWKIIACTAVIPIFFCVVACQDQAENQYTEVEVLKQSVEYPQKVQDALIRLKKESPDDKFVVLPPFGGKLKDYDLDESAMEDGARPDVLTIITSDIKDVNNNPMSYIIFQYKSKNKQPATEDEVVEVEVPVLKGVFTVVEEPPTYQGGTEKIAAFISQNLRYPEKAKSENIEGSVYVSFIIEPDGSVQEAKVIKGIDAACDAEAIRIIKLMNNWNPGKQNGKAVRTQFVLPVKFKL